MSHEQITEELMLLRREADKSRTLAVEIFKSFEELEEVQRQAWAALRDRIEQSEAEVSRLRDGLRRISQAATEIATMTPERPS